MSSFVLKNVDSIRNMIGWDYNSLKSFTDDANLNYVTAYRVLKSKHVKRQSAVDFTVALKDVGYDVDFKSIFLIK